MEEEEPPITVEDVLLSTKEEEHQTLTISPAEKDHDLPKKSSQEPEITVEDVLLSTKEEEEEKETTLTVSSAEKDLELPEVIQASIHSDERLPGEERATETESNDVIVLNNLSGRNFEAVENADIVVGDQCLDFRLLDVMEEDVSKETEIEVSDMEIVELSVEIFDAPDAQDRGTIVSKSLGDKEQNSISGELSAGYKGLQMETKVEGTQKDSRLCVQDMEIIKRPYADSLLQVESGDLLTCLSKKRKFSEVDELRPTASDTVVTLEEMDVEVIAKATEVPPDHFKQQMKVDGIQIMESESMQPPPGLQIVQGDEDYEGDLKNMEFPGQPMKGLEVVSTQQGGAVFVEASSKKRKTLESQSPSSLLVGSPIQLEDVNLDGQFMVKDEMSEDILAGRVVTDFTARKGKSSDSGMLDAALSKGILTANTNHDRKFPGIVGKSVEILAGGSIMIEGRDTPETLSAKRRKKRRGSGTLSQEIPDQVGGKGVRSLRQQVRVSTYDESLGDATIEQHLGTLPSRAQRRKRKLATSEKAFDAEATIAAAIGFPRESLTEEEVEAGVVQTVGSQEQANYIVVRNHILAKWRENVDVYLQLETVMESIRAQHKSLVSSAYKFLLTHGYINFGVAPAIKAMIKVETNRASVIIIGAGLAGLGAARQLIAFGHKVLVIEGRQRPGGRVYTKRMEGDSLMTSADLGGSVITGIEGNPLGVLARQLKIPLHNIRDKCPLYQHNGLPVKEDVDSKVEMQFNKLLDGASKWREDMEQAADSISLGATLETLRQIEGVGGTAEERQLYDWHLANLEYANAGLLTKLSLAFWDQDDPYEMGGDHCFLPGGNVTLINALAEDVPIQYGKTVHTVKYGNEGVKVIVGEESYEADMVLCTVPLGVLQRGMVKFEPELPQRKRDAIKRLGFGLLNKVVMLFPKVFWGSELDVFGHLAENPSKRGEFFLFYSYATVSEGPLLLALVAGEAAIEFEQTPPLQAVTRVMNILRGIYEPRGIQVPNPVQTVCTRWGSDFLCYGSYSNVAVGASGDDYDILAESVGDGRLFFAGEATIRRYPATMHGAYLSGLREAGNIAAATSSRQAAPKGEHRLPKDMHLYSSTLAELFKEPDLEFGSFSIIFDHQTNDPKAVALVRLLNGGNKRKSSGVLMSEKKVSSVVTSEQQFHMYTTITRQQAYELREVRGGDSVRFAYLCQKLGVKLVGRRGLGPQGDALVVAIKWHRATKKSGLMHPPKLLKPVATSVRAFSK